MMAKVTLRNLAAHKIRLVLTAVAVILGVAFVGGTLIFTDTMNRRFDDLFDSIGRDVAVAVRAKEVVSGANTDGQNSEPIPASVLDTLRKVEGVRNPIGNVTGYAAVVGPDGKVIGGNGPPQLGVAWTPGSDYRLSSGRPPSGPHEVALDTATAEKAKAGIGGTVQVVTSGTSLRARVVGLMDTGNMMGASITAFDTPTAQRLLLKPGHFSDIQVGSDGVGETELRDRVAKVLPPNLEAITGEQMREDAKSEVAQFMSFFRTFLLVFALISIFVGAFIIFNTFSMLVAQRTRELALLRAIGAARAQVTRAVLGEAVAVGAVGSTIGLAAGAGLALLLNRQVMGEEASGLVLTANPVIASYVVGIVVTVVSAYFPARRAAKIPPVAAMRDDVALPQRSLRVRVALGSLLVVVGAGLAAAGLAGGGSPALLVGVGAFLVFLGVTMLAPVISVPVVRVLGAPAARLLGAPGRLARQNALRNPRRTAATAAALMIGLALITTVNVLGASMRTSVEAQVDRQFGADYIVQPAGMARVGPEVVGKVRSTPGVSGAAPAYYGTANFNGKRTGYSAGTPSALAEATRLKLSAGSLDTGRDGLLVEENTARANGWTVGGTVRAQFPDGKTQNLRITGLYAKNALVGQYLVAEAAHLAHTARPALAAVFVDADRPGAGTLRALETTLRDMPNLEVRDQAALKDNARKQVDGFVSFLTVLLVMSVIIAAVGVVNTLALSVIERTREIGLLRAIGLSRRQLRRMVRMESIVIAVFGAVLGIGVGVAFGTALQRALREDGLSHLSVPYGTLIAYLVIAAVIGVLAALWPAWRAGRMDVLKAISTE